MQHGKDATAVKHIDSSSNTIQKNNINTYTVNVLYCFFYIQHIQVGSKY